MTTWNAAPMPELGLELVRDVDRERIRSRLPRWDPRLWGDAQFSKNTRPGNRLLKLGLAWGRERVKARKLQQENVTLEGDVAPVSRFTGKEEDVEVGLQYFGKRFLSPYLGRWISPDPLAVHAPGQADLNLYAYVHGAVLKAIDPVGLEDPHVQAANDEGTKATQEHESFTAQAKLQEDALNDQYVKAVGEQQRFGTACEMSASCWQQAAKAQAKTESIRAQLDDLRGKVADEAKAFADFKEAWQQTVDYYRDVATTNFGGDGYIGPANHFVNNQKAAYDKVAEDIKRSGIFSIPVAVEAVVEERRDGSVNHDKLASRYKKAAAINQVVEKLVKGRAEFQEADIRAGRDDSSKINGARVPGTTPKGPAPELPPADARGGANTNFWRAFTDWLGQK